MRKESHKIGEITMLPACGMLVRCRFHCDKTISHHFVALSNAVAENQRDSGGLMPCVNMCTPLCPLQYRFLLVIVV